MLARKHFFASEVLSSDAYRAIVSDEENNQSVTKDAFEVLHFVGSKRLALGRLTVILKRPGLRPSAGPQRRLRRRSGRPRPTRPRHGSPRPQHGSRRFGSLRPRQSRHEIAQETAWQKCSDLTWSGPNACGNRRVAGRCSRGVHWLPRDFV